MTTGDLWITHYSVQRWNFAKAWDDYLLAVEALLSDRLVKLDDTDPIRRKADIKNGEGKFVIQFGEQEASRWVRGKFEKTKVEIAIQHYKSGADSFGRERENTVTFYVPERMTFGPDARNLVKLFHLGNERLGSFYAYADLKKVICAKKPSTPSLDISRELLGVFWLTYFGAPYCTFFSSDRLLRLQQAAQGPADGITLQLAETAGQVPDCDRAKLEQEIGAESFAGNGGAKDKGKYALTLAQLNNLNPRTNQ